MDVHKSAQQSITAAGMATVVAVVANGTPPVITLTGDVTQPCVSVQVRVTLGGARGVWTGTYSIDGGATTNAFTSAATVAMSGGLGSGLTLNITTGTATIGDTWDAAQDPASIAALELANAGAPLGPVSVRVTGTFVSAILLAEADIIGDGNWLPCKLVTNPAAVAADSVTLSTSQGVAYTIPRAGFAQVRVRCIKKTSGTVKIDFAIARA